jgi:hypothetical protein
MNEKMTVTTVGAIEDKLRIYDEICGAAFVNLFSFSKESEVIAFSPFDPKNEDHLFFLGVAKGLAGSLGKKVAVDVNKFQLWKLNRGIDKECRIVKFDMCPETVAIDPNWLVGFMSPNAKKVLGEQFTFGEIYRQYYSKKGKKK